MASASSSGSGAASARRAGHLVIIGGNEDRLQDKRVLRRFVELTGCADPRLVILGCSGADGAARELDRAFAELGVTQRARLAIASRDDANDLKAADLVCTADGVFIPGGDAHGLLALLAGTAVHEALKRACAEHARCLAATDAGAQALSQYVMLDRSDASSLAAGLGLVQRALIDPRFSERRRLGPLLALVAANPQLIGVGIDEDTALVIEPGGGIEVVGDGAVTLIDGREMRSLAVATAGRPPALELVDVKLHLLPAGTAYRQAAGPGIPPTLGDLVAILIRPGVALS
jgi:cyanophycinase